MIFKAFPPVLPPPRDYTKPHWLGASPAAVAAAQVWESDEDNIGRSPLRPYICLIPLVGVTAS
ncbi:MAG: hypothetical protein VKJ09_04475 [Leptolyngbya sp.]|nr:hypothetical protein [Leptolyngbya sp.]